MIRNNVIRKNLNQSNNICSYPLESKNLFYVDYLLSPNFYAIYLSLYQHSKILTIKRTNFYHIEFIMIKKS